MKIKVPPIYVILLGAVLGAVAGGIVGALKGLAYALALSIAASLVSLIPVAGPIMVWFWLMPLFKSIIGVGGEMLVVDIIVMLISVFVNAIVVFLIALILFGKYFLFKTRRF